MTKAPDILQAGIDAMADRAATRDQPSGERSMARAVAIYHAAKGSSAIGTERDGWLFMICLKLARAQGGGHNLDDYIDGAAYCALMGEAADGNTPAEPASQTGPHAHGWSMELTADDIAEIERGPDDLHEIHALLTLSTKPPLDTVSVLQNIAEERCRQISVEGWSPEHDDIHTSAQLGQAAACYAMPAGLLELRMTALSAVPVYWPWAEFWWKPKDRRSDLIRAAALIVAELERLDRQAARGERNG